MLHIKKIKPLFTAIVTTGDKFDEDWVEQGLIVARKGDLKLWQKVIAVGSAVRDVKEGDMVMLDFKDYAVKKYDKNSIQNDLNNNPVLDYHLNWVTIDEEDGKTKDCLVLKDRDVQYVFEGEEKKEALMTPGKKTFIIGS